jgi:hypothetical protein
MQFPIKHGSGPIKCLNLRALLVIQITAYIPDTINMEHSTCCCLFSVYTYVHLDRHIAVYYQNHFESCYFITPGKNVLSYTDPNLHLSSIPLIDQLFCLKFDKLCFLTFMKISFFNKNLVYKFKCLFNFKF